jgi:GGDEF domain-containing protein
MTTTRASFPETAVAPLPANEAQRDATLRVALASWVPREERFDRLTRLAKRLMDVPYAAISVLHDDTQWFRSVQGLSVSESPRASSFCSHAILQAGVMVVPDTLLDPRFANNPAVVGPPHVRTYVGWPIELAPGLRAGTLCVADTMPRTFNDDEIEALADLARLAENELRVDTLGQHQRDLLAQADRKQRRRLLDPVTGMWSQRGFLALLDQAQRSVAVGASHAAVLALNWLNAPEFGGSVQGDAQRVTRAMLWAQVLRRRLPATAVMCRVSGNRAAVLLSAPSTETLNAQLDAWRSPQPLGAGAGLTFERSLETLTVTRRLHGGSNAADDLRTALVEVAAGQGEHALIQ